VGLGWVWGWGCGAVIGWSGVDALGPPGLAGSSNQARARNAKCTEAEAEARCAPEQQPRERGLAAAGGPHKCDRAAGGHVE